MKDWPHKANPRSGSIRSHSANYVLDLHIVKISSGGLFYYGLRAAIAIPLTA